MTVFTPVGADISKAGPTEKVGEHRGAPLYGPYRPVGDTKAQVGSSVSGVQGKLI